MAKAGIVDGLFICVGVLTFGEVLGVEYDSDAQNLESSGIGVRWRPVLEGR